MTVGLLQVVARSTHHRASRLCCDEAESVAQRPVGGESELSRPGRPGAFGAGWADFDAAPPARTAESGRRMASRPKGASIRRVSDQRLAPRRRHGPWRRAPARRADGGAPRDRRERAFAAAVISGSLREGGNDRGVERQHGKRRADGGWPRDRRERAFAASVISGSLREGGMDRGVERQHGRRRADGGWPRDRRERRERAQRSASRSGGRGASTSTGLAGPSKIRREAWSAWRARPGTSGPS